MKRSKRAVYQDDEFYLILRGKVYHLFGSFDGRLIRMSCGTTDLARAKLFLENKKRELVHGWREDYDCSDQDWKDVARAMHERQKRGAFNRGMTFELTPGGIYALMKATGFRCAVSGVPFAKRPVSDGKRDPWAPSIDRIENRQGYTMENSRIVCLVANIAMGDWGFDTLLRLTRGIHRSSLTLSDEPTQGPLKEAQEIDKPLMQLVK
jgi:hypothetical protein